MAYTTHVLPLSGQGLGTTVANGTSYTDTHKSLHARSLTGGVENVRAHSAVGDDTTDDTTAFIKAINNLKAASPGGGGKLVVPAGYYRVNGDTILAALAGLSGWVIEGDGALQTNIRVFGAASSAFGWDSVSSSVIRDITFQGGGKASGQDGFLQYGNCTNNNFYNVRFNIAENGFRCIADPVTPAQNQNERNAFFGCQADNSTVGYRINSNNAQGQLFEGGGASGNTTAFYGSGGSWAQFNSWFCSAGGTGTGWKTDGGWISTSLNSCLDENVAVSFNLTNGGTLHAVNTYFQGLTNTILSTVASYIDATNCHFLTGTFSVGDNTVFWDRQNTHTGTFATGTNSTRHQYAGDGYRLYYNNAAWTTPRLFRSNEGYTDYLALAKPAAPAAGYVRTYQTNVSSKMTAQDSGGTEHDFY